MEIEKIAKTDREDPFVRLALLARDVQRAVDIARR
jgi:hypothetical protein